MTHVLVERGYPGRGLLATRTGDGLLWFAYFLTGRSAGSRSRELVVLDNGDVQVRDTGDRPYDSLRHYTAVARRGSWCVVGNGDQVVPLAEDLAAGVGELQAASRHSYEPDPPIHTSRIWLAHSSASASDCLVGSARRSVRGGDGADRTLLDVAQLTTGTGVLMTTYDGSVTDVRGTSAALDVVVLAASGEELLAEIWAALNPARRVAAVILRPDRHASPALFVGAD